jgi:putative transposase
VNKSIVCAQFGISRQAHFQKQQRELIEYQENELILEMVRQVRRRHPRMGSRKLLCKIQPMMALEDLSIGRDRFFSLLKSQNMLISKKKFYRHTTIPGYWRAPNRLPGLIVDHPNQVWVCDITYLELEVGRFAYLFLLMDLFARYIVGWYVASSLVTDGALMSLQMALLGQSSIPFGLIHHSDHGVQYTSHVYMDTLLRNHLLPSMGEIGNCYDNIYAERVIGILKNEYLLDMPFVQIEQVSPIIKEVVDLYNTDRPHLSLNMVVPAEVYMGYHKNIHPVVIPTAA